MKRIFLVEDDPDIARNLSRLLGAEGYAVTRAAGQGEAMARLEGGGFDLALVDISLPDGNGFIVKPFRPRELVARIQAALRKYGRAGGVLRVGALQVDTAGGTVTRDGQEVFLSALEYRLLLVFANNPRTVLTRERLLGELWDAAGEFVNDNTLTVYIKRLREKIEPDPAAPRYILTVRGLGYRLGDGHAE